MKKPRPDHTLEFLLAFDGRTHWLDQDYCIRFEIRRVPASASRAHGLRYSFTLHDPDGRRLVGFDNAHAVPAVGSRHKRSPKAADHWHRTQTDKGRPYRFESADKLLADFFAEVHRVLGERGISDETRRVSNDADERR